MPRPRTKIPDDLLPELEERRSEQGQSLGQLVRFLARNGVEISEEALSWQLLRMGIDLPPRRRQTSRTRPGAVHRRSNGVVVRRFTPMEDELILRYGREGLRPTAIGRILKEKHGIERKQHSILGRMMTLARHDARQSGD